MTKAKVAEVPTGTAVVSMAERIANRIANIDKTTDTSGMRNISCKAKKFTLPGGASSAGPLNAIVLHYVNTNAWWEVEYDPNNPAPPDCTASHEEPALMKPGVQVEKPVHSDCATCPKNEWGSKGRGKACGNSVNLAVVPEDFTNDSEVVTLKVSATGLKRWSTYVRALAESGLDPVQVVTSFSFADTEYPSLKFKALDKVKDVDKLGQFMAEAETLLKS
jgi:hypothetical protein